MKNAKLKRHPPITRLSETLDFKATRIVRPTSEAMFKR